MSEEMFNQLFSRNLLRLMNEHGISQAQMAKYLNVSPGSVSAWTRGLTTPRMDKIDAMCELFNCKRSDLIAIESDQHYYDEKTAEMAQELFENKDLRVLFDAAKDVPPEDLKLVHDMLLRMKKAETGNDD